jgi:hypothetical protein
VELKIVIEFDGRPVTFGFAAFGRRRALLSAKTHVLAG